MDLLEIRRQLDETDKKMVELFEKRMELCGEVAKAKLQTGKKVLDKERELQKLSDVKELAHGEFNKKGVQELFKQVMATSRKLQYQAMMDANMGLEVPFQIVEHISKETSKVIYQGVPGAYSYVAAKTYFGGSVDYQPVKTFAQAMEAVIKQECDYAVLPIENTTAGIVNDVYDLLVKYNPTIVDIIDIKVSHALLGLPEAELSDIRTVYSHPQGLMQCSDFLEQYPDWRQIAQANTAGSAKKVVEEQDKSQAAIASKEAAELYGLKVLKENIVHNQKNVTRFIVVSNELICKKEADKVFLYLELPHESGSLYEILSHFIFNDLNLTKIESRPIVGKSWEYRFFIEFEGNLQDAAVKNALNGISEEARRVKILGNY